MTVSYPMHAVLARGAMVMWASYHDLCAAASSPRTPEECDLIEAARQAAEATTEASNQR